MFMFPGLNFNLNDFKNAALQFPNGAASGGVAGWNNNNTSSQNANGSSIKPEHRDEDSMDNKNTSLNFFQTLSTFTAPNPDLIQANLEKMMVSDALEVVSCLPLDLHGGDPGDESGIDEKMDIKHEADMDISGGGGGGGGAGEEEEEYLTLADITVNTVLPDAVIPFTFKLPATVPPYLNAHYTCETGSRLLFSSILWLGKVPVFQQLPEDLQNALIRAAWAEIFVLNFVQMSGLLSFNAVMTCIVDYFKTVAGQEQTPVEKILTMSENVCLLNEFVRDTERLQLDDLSFAALRIVILFSARGVRRDFPQFSAQMSAVVDVASMELRRQLARSVDANDTLLDESKADEQFVRVIMRVAGALSKFNANVIEELFFTNMAGQVNVESVIPYILRLGNSSNVPVVRQEAQ